MLTQDNARVTHNKQVLARHDVHLNVSQRVAHVGSYELDFAIPFGSGVGLWHSSNETYRILGYDPRTVTMNRELFYARVHPDDIQQVQELFLKTIETGCVFELEHRLLMPDGTEKVVYEKAEMIADPETGIPVRVIGIIKDITDRKNARAQLLKADKELRTLFENMAEAYFSFDFQFNRYTQMSKACEKVFGYGIPEFDENANLWYEIILPEDRHIIDEGRSLVNRGVAVVHEYRIRQKGGKICWVESKIKPTLDSTGKLIRIDGITSDITERMDAKIELKNNELKFRSLIENSSDFISVINERIELVFISDTIYRLTGFKPEELIGSWGLRYIHPDDRLIVAKDIEALIINPAATRKLVYRIFKKDGSIIWIERIAKNMMNEPGIRGIVSNFRDITENKLREDELKAINEDLKKSNMELDRFVYSVSHDLRAPLSSMLGLVDLSENENLNEDLKKNFELLKGSIQKLDGFISDILDYSRNKRMEIKTEKINFKSVLGEVVDNLKFMDIKNRHVAIRTDLHNGIPFYSDKNRIDVILNNLVSNSIRYYNPEATDPYVDITVKVTVDSVLIVVKDNGMGIPKELQQKVFEMFYRASKNSVGSGLGLYIVKETVEKLHGTIQIESEPPVGTTFSISLPNQFTN